MPYLKEFPFFRRRNQYDERENQFLKLLEIAEFLDYQSQYFPTDTKVEPIALYRKVEPRWFYFKVPLTGNKKNKLLYRRLEEFSRGPGLYVEVVPVHIWDRRTLIRVQLSRELMDVVCLREDKYKVMLSRFCEDLRAFIGYEEWEKLEYYKNGQMQRQVRRIYPPEKGKEDG